MEYNMNRSASPTAVPQASARERLLAAANELFYAEGVQTVGIDRIIDQAGVAKASLYNLFGSKEELVAAYLQSRHDATSVRLTAAIEKCESPREKIMAIFDSQAKLFRSSDFHGCAFTSASAEAAAGGRVERAADEFRTWMRTLFINLARAAGAAQPTTLGRQLHLLYDGAGLAARMDHGDPSISKSTREAVRTLLDAAIS
jgi:AcrR family transcriptional regulator